MCVFKQNLCLRNVVWHEELKDFKLEGSVRGQLQVPTVCLFSAACPVQRAVSSPTLPSLTNGGRPPPHSTLESRSLAPGSIFPRNCTQRCALSTCRTFSVTVAIISINFSKRAPSHQKEHPHSPTESTGAASSWGCC